MSMQSLSNILYRCNIRIHFDPLQRSEAYEGIREMTHTNNSNLFEGLKAAIREHASSNFLRLKDGESADVIVDVDLMNADPNKRTPREEQVENFDKTAKVWKLRLDCRVGSSNKVFYIGDRHKADVVALLERGVRKIRISRSGADAKTTKYVFTEVTEQQ
jgi:hypothetical protein